MNNDLLNTLQELGRERQIEEMDSRLFTTKTDAKPSKSSVYKYTRIEEWQKKEIKFLLEENNKLWAEV